MHFLINLLSFTSFMKSVGGVLLAVVILLAMITVHEFGHYLAGRILGFRVNEFSIGFGPAVFKRRSKKTGRIFALRIVPLGGYCAFDGEDEIEDEKGEKPDVEEEPFPEWKSEEEPTQENVLCETEQKEEEYPTPPGERFNDQPPWKRIIVLIAGATMNYLLALICIVVMFACLGRPVYSVMKEKPNTQPSVAQTETGLQTGDIILKIEGKNVYTVTDYMDILDGKKAGDLVTFTVVSNGETTERQVLLAQDAKFVNMSDTITLLRSMGVYGLYATTEKQSFFDAIGHSFAYSVKLGGMILRTLGELLTGKLGLETMGGPVTTIKVTSEVASSSLASFLNITALIGVNLAVFNLLPIPALDGCKVIFCLIEWIRKKPINRKVETMIHFIGIIFLFAFAILVDLLQLF